METRSTKCYFLGYEPHSKAIRALNLSNGRVVYSREYIFQELESDSRSKDSVDLIDLSEASSSVKNSEMVAIPVDVSTKTKSNTLTNSPSGPQPTTLNLSHSYGSPGGPEDSSAAANGTQTSNVANEASESFPVGMRTEHSQEENDTQATNPPSTPEHIIDVSDYLSSDPQDEMELGDAQPSTAETRHYYY